MYHSNPDSKRDEIGVYPIGRVADESDWDPLLFLHLFEQNRTSCQQRAHFFRHANRLPQAAQTFSGFGDLLIVCNRFCESVAQRSKVNWL